MNRTIKEIQKAAPFIENSSFIFLLGKLIIDVLILDSFGVIVIRHTTNSIGEHPLKQDRLLSSLRNPVIFFARSTTALISLCCFRLRWAGIFISLVCFFLLEKQCVLPPFSSWY